MARSRSIRLSERHGVNPTIPVCFWCGKERNEVALLGKLPGDAEAPRSMVLDFEPCDECKRNMALGFTVMEATTAPNEVCSKEFQSGVYPTGKWVVIKHEAAKRLFPGFDSSASKAFLESDVFRRLFER